MKKFVGIISIIAFLLIGVVWWMTRNISEKEIVIQESENNSVSAAQNEEKNTPSDDGGYMVKEYKGAIAVFENKEDTPFYTTTISVKELPPADRELLQKGIAVACTEELNALLEDYCS